jgi:hypothetical protein
LCNQMPMLVDIPTVNFLLIWYASSTKLRTLVELASFPCLMH